MKSILMTLMMLVMLTPGLACAQTMCANMDAMAEQIEDMPCHGEMADALAAPGVMIALDCAGIDLAKADGAASVKAPGSPEQIDYALAFNNMQSGVPSADDHLIRGPPPVRLGNLSYPAIYLGTQRIRI